ncbi:lysozyme inhibitor LprI family protein [Hoeflea sp. CAU 1731]
MRLRCLMTASLTVLLPASAIADPSFECSMGSGSQVETAECVAKTEAMVDETVKLSLQFAMNAAKELDETTGRAAAVPALEKAQDAWSTFRDVHCDYVGSTFGGGSGTGIAIRSCRIELGRDRADLLLRFAK